MAFLNISLVESKIVQNQAKVKIQFSKDVQEDIIAHSKELFEIEILHTGYIKENADSCTLSFTLTDPDKITKLKEGMVRAVISNNNQLN